MIPPFFPVTACHPTASGGEGRPDAADEDGPFIRNVKISRVLLFSFLFSFLVYLIVFLLFFTVSDFLVILGLSMLCIGPAYIANAMMVFTSDGVPLDGGRTFIDGRRLFGQTKTRGGFIGGTIIGFGCGLLFNLIFYFSFPVIIAFAATQEEFLSLVTLDYLEAFLAPPGWMIPVRALFSGLGSPLGDLAGSFLKRRVGIGSGKPFWIVDQLDFITVTILLCLPWFPLNGFSVVMLVLMSPSITLFANTVAHAAGKKREPW